MQQSFVYYFVYNIAVSDAQFVLQGPDTVTAFVSRLRQVTYDNAAAEPTVGNRTVAVRVDDGRHDSNLLLITLSVSLVDDNRLVISCSDGENTTFTEASGNRSSTPVAVAPNLVLSDRDLDHTISSAVVRLVDNPDGSDESIAGTSMFGLIAENLEVMVNVSSSGKDFEYRALLAAIEYNNKALEPTGGIRLVSFKVYDGRKVVECTRSIEVVTVNDNTPVVDLNGASVDGVDYSTRVDFLSVDAVVVAPAAATVTDADGVITEVRLDVDDPKDDERFVVCKLPSATSCVITYAFCHMC